jgi:glycosyltransferase involved in cell wall biosynthesis
MIACNARVLSNQLTGVPRYILELLARFGDRAQLVRPLKPLAGIRGHAWEQFVLPTLIGKRLLWSPSITGPLAVERQVVTIHDVVPLDHPEWLNENFAAWYRFLTPKLTRRVRRILVVSEFTKRRLIHHCPEAESKIKVVLLAADKRFAPADELAIAAMSRQLALPSRSYLVALGSLEPRKNLARLLQAWSIVQSRIPNDVWLVIAGGKGKSIVFENVTFAPLPPRVHLTGFVADELLPALYSGAIASVYVSLYEGFGFPPLESMACGAPVLTSNVSSLPEVVGEAALTVNPVDIDAIADSMLRLVDDSALRTKLRLRGFERASQFSWDQTALTTLRELEDANG